MNRREFIKFCSMTVVAAGWAISKTKVLPAQDRLKVVDHKSSSDNLGQYEEYIKDYLYKMEHFNEVANDDIFLEKKDYETFESVLNRLTKIQKGVGYGNFHLISFDEILYEAKTRLTVGEFTKNELKFMEELFYKDGTVYGFMGDKPVKTITAQINKSRAIKMPYTGNYIYKGKPLDTYEKIIKDVGEGVILTSGIRSVVKQFYLFLSKTKLSNGNLSLASRSLAPPGYSFHGVGDFDVGKVGFGPDNFTEKFVETDIFKKLTDLGYIQLRYKKQNFLGVRFEPWHIKVVS